MMAQIFKRIVKFNKKTVALIGLLMFALFCFAGGLNLLDGLTEGFSSSTDARFGVTATFYGGFLFTGFFGLMYALKNKLVASKCLLGLVVVVFSYVGFEVLFNVVVGR
jgi:hypothetical protein